jgi:outer membrane immunogenic protein
MGRLDSWAARLRCRSRPFVCDGWGGVRIDREIPFTGISIGGDGTRVGWTVEAGLDYAFTNNWFTGIEYRYSHYQSKTLLYPMPILNLGVIGLKQQQSSRGAPWL